MTKKTNKNGRIIWEGPSELDGSPIVVIATGFNASSSNEKTGDLIQTWIMAADVAPHVAVKIGADRSVCGDCPHRPENLGTCYVKTFQAPRSAWTCYTSGSGYARFDAAADAELCEGRKLRLGSYGDPAAVPFQVWESLVALFDGHTGYTHQWRGCDPRFASLVMASADTSSDRAAANAKGYRTFRVKPAGDTTKEQGEFVCPASEERGFKTDCASCLACGGTSAKARADVTIQAHGATAKRFADLVAHLESRETIAS